MCAVFASNVIGVLRARISRNIRSIVIYSLDERWEPTNESKSFASVTVCWSTTKCLVVFLVESEPNI